MSDFSSIRPNIAIQSAYGKARDLKGERTGAAAQPEAAQGPDFSQMLENAAADAVHTVRHGDTVASAGLAGHAGMQQVVEATMAMESTVRVSVALRDKLVEAYQEIMRMPI